jgi:hypothetical protein
MAFEVKPAIFECRAYSAADFPRITRAADKYLKMGMGSCQAARFSQSLGMPTERDGTSEGQRVAYIGSRKSLLQWGD